MYAGLAYFQTTLLISTVAIYLKWKLNTDTLFICQVIVTRSNPTFSMGTFSNKILINKISPNLLSISKCTWNKKQVLWLVDNSTGLGFHWNPIWFATFVWNLMNQTCNKSHMTSEKFQCWKNVVKYEIWIINLWSKNTQMWSLWFVYW